MKELNIRECKVCSVRKERILAGKYPDGRNSKWTDSNDREWNGRVCPDCHASRAKVVMKRARSA